MQNFQNLPNDPETYSIIGACFNVHSILGHGFLEAVYQEALAIELQRQNIPYEQEKQTPIFYQGLQLKTYYQMDFLCFGDVIVELKALTHLSGTEEAQVINYLKATGFHRALLINFGSPKLDYKRLVLGYEDRKKNFHL